MRMSKILIRYRFNFKYLQNNNFERLSFYSRTLVTKIIIAVGTFQAWWYNFSLKIKQEIKIKLQQHPYFWSYSIFTKTMG
jgi:hypothetical protein